MERPSLCSHLPRYGITRSSVLAETILGAVLAMLPLGTGLVTPLSLPPRATQTLPCHGLTHRVVQAGADLGAVFAPPVEGTGAVAVAA